MKTEWPQGYSLDSVTHWVCGQEGIAESDKGNALEVVAHALTFWHEQGCTLYGRQSGAKYIRKQCERYVMQQMRPDGWYGFAIWPLLWSSFISAIVQLVMKWLMSVPEAREKFDAN